MRKLSLVAVRKSKEIRLLSGAIDRLLIKEPCGLGSGPQLAVLRHNQRTAGFGD